MNRYRKGKGMDLATLLETQFLVLRGSKVTAEHTKNRYRRAVAWLSEATQHATTTADLTDDSLAALASYLRDARGQCPRTINGSLECLRCLWRWCRDRQIEGVRGGPTFAPLKVAARQPRAWTEEEITRLVQAADAAGGSIGGMPARTWWLTLFALVMDTGARANELLSMRWEWLDWRTGTLSVDASVRKGGVRSACYGLRKATLDWLAPLKQPDGLILRWDMDPSRLYQIYGGLLRSAGLPNTRYTKLHCLRRTFATLLELNGGDATQALGHASRATTLKHYLDPTRTARVHADVIPFHPVTAVG